MSSDILREFLVQLGFQVNKNQENAFVQSVVNVTARVTALGAAVEAAGTLVVAFTAKVADGLERLYFASERTGAAADNIRAIGYAAAQMGSSAESAEAALEGLAQRIKTNPGYGALIANLTGGRANLADSASIFRELGAALRAMPLPQANAYAGVFGIDYKLLLAMREGTGPFSAEYAKRLKAFGVNMNDAAAAGRKFGVQFKGLREDINIITTDIGARLAKRLAVDVARFDEFLQKHGRQIADVIEKITSVILGAADGVTRLALRLGEGIVRLKASFDALPAASKEIIKWFGLVLIAWRALNVGFLSSPLGLIMALGAAILLLWDDYQTFQEKGKTLIDWKAWEPNIKKAKEWLVWLGEKFDELAVKTGAWKGVLMGLLVFTTISWAGGMLAAIGRVAFAFAALTLPGWLTALLIAIPAITALLVGSSSTTNGGAPNELNPLQRAFAANSSIPVEGAALLDSISEPESGGRYDIRYGGVGSPGKTISDYSHHPGIMEPTADGQQSSAAGRYQITKTTWDEFAPRAGVSNFLPQSQDLVALEIAKDAYSRKFPGRNLLVDLNDPARRGDIQGALWPRWHTANLGSFGQNLTREQQARRSGVYAQPSDAPQAPGTAAPAPSRLPAIEGQRLGGAMPPAGSSGVVNGTGASVAIQQSTTINVNGQGTSTEVAQRVAEKQDGVNSALARNTRGAIR